MTRESGAPSLPCIVGPTASGKSLLAARLAALVGGEVISADSVQVYRGFDIGAGKPTPHERSLAPHHLIDIAPPDHPIEAQVWAHLAEGLVEEIRSRDRLPIVCGGTFLWIRALVYGLAEAPPASEEVRQRHRQLAEEQGRASLHEQLVRVDPASAARLHPNDLVRVSRALEVFELSGRRLSEIQQGHGFREARHPAVLVTIDWPREEYEARLSQRIRRMLDDGLVEEVRRLLAAGHRDTRAMAAVGYRQVVEALELGEPLDEVALHQAIVRVSRIFARRQRTWLRDEPVVRVSPAALSDDTELRRYSARLGLLE